MSTFSRVQRVSVPKPRRKVREWLGIQTSRRLADYHSHTIHGTGIMYTYMSNEKSGYFGDYATQFCGYIMLYTSSGDEILLMHIRFIIGMVRIPSSTSQINLRKFQHIPGTYCWWKKSQTTTWDVENLVNNGITYVPINWCRISFVNSTPDP